MIPTPIPAPTSSATCKSRRRRSPVVAVLLVVTVARSLLSVESADRPTVVPGSLVQWRGSGIQACSLGDDEWSALDDACWYPIDLLTTEGPLVLSRTRNGDVEHATVHVAPYPYPVQKLTLDQEMVHPPEDQLERIELESRRVAALWHGPGSAMFKLPLAPPLTPLPEARSFGSRRILNDVPRSPHSGVDFSCPTGTPVFAVADGVVVLAEEHYFSGRSVFIDHGDQLVSAYFHLSELSVSEGEAVISGEMIGRVGATGRVTGAHLHFGVRWHGARIDPRLLLGTPSEIVVIGDSREAP